MHSNLDYWQPVYASARVPTFPSQFAVFVHSWMCGEDIAIVEVGCGNGRDSLFFHSMGHRVCATDQIISAELAHQARSSDRFDVIESDVSNVIRQLESQIDLSKPIVFYSRFFQHAISETDQFALLHDLSTELHPDSLLFFEFRLDQDKNAPKEFGSDHFRRFQSSEEFLDTLKQCRYECIFSCEGYGFARYKSEEPYVGRFVAKPTQANLLKLVAPEGKA